ncbi:MAG: N-acetyltransferase, partial [Anaerolineae bacterium]
MKLRRATLADAQEITDLVNYWFRKTGDVLPRTLDSVCESIRSWVVVEDQDGIVGCGALVVLGPGLAEIRSVVIRPGSQGNGAGRTIVEQLLIDAEEIRVPTVFTLTKAIGFFEKMGFKMTEMELFPRKVWKDCVHCSKFPECDEVAMV